MDKSALAKIQRYIDKFKNIDIILQFSISVDGAIMEHYSRPLNNGKEKTEEFYENLFIFAKHNNFAFHPMVSSYNVKHWIENYQWWMEKFN
jgi:sulfatase maturation enzyme AslB (radical SAM superfamily)